MATLNFHSAHTSLRQWMRLCRAAHSAKLLVTNAQFSCIRLIFATILGEGVAEGGVRLEFAFESKELRDVCESELEAKRHLGNPVAEMLKHRLADLDAAPSAKDIIAGRPRLGENRETMVVDLCEGSRLVFTANHPSNPRTATGELDWKNVRRIRILRIESDRA